MAGRLLSKTACINQPVIFSSASKQAVDRLKLVADVSALEPSTWKPEDKASYQPLHHDKETIRILEYHLNLTNQALV